MKKVTIVDYGIGNMLSVARAFQYHQAEIEITAEAKRIEQAERLVLPGVGAFADGMKELINSNIIEALSIFSKTNRPFLGICLGMQMMMEYSEEFGIHEGLGFVEGKVKKISNYGSDGRPHKIPHIGWKKLYFTKTEKNKLLNGIDREATFYFVHSYTAETKHENNCIAKCKYNGLDLTAIVKKDIMFGCQFHPEKSGVFGLKIIENFLAI